MSLEQLEAQDERDALEFLNVGLDRREAVCLLRRVLRDSPELTQALDNRVEVDVAASLLADAWLLGATAARFAMQGLRVCHVCGCTTHRPCIVNGEACAWAGEHLCSECEAYP